jgi:hypothetical protein
MIINKRARSCVQTARESFLKIQDMFMDSARASAKSDEVTAWQDVEILFQLAKEVDGFRKRLDSLLGDPTPEPTCVATFPQDATQKHSRVTTHAQEPLSKKKKSDYPRYLISDNCLLKIGLQRDRKTEYQHIVQKAAFDKIVSVITSHLAKDKDFTAESIQNELNIPSYQTYVVLAMLRQKGLLKIPRRGLYTASDAPGFIFAASGVWNKLSTIGEHKNDNN